MYQMTIPDFVSISFEVRPQYQIFPNMVTEMLKFDAVGRRAAISVIYHWKAEAFLFQNNNRRCEGDIEAGKKMPI